MIKPTEELYDEAVLVTRTHNLASASLLQRTLNIGYAQAAQLLDMMYRRGVVGPSIAPKPREILNTAHGEYSTPIPYPSGSETGKVETKQYFPKKDGYVLLDVEEKKADDARKHMEYTKEIYEKGLVNFVSDIIASTRKDRTKEIWKDVDILITLWRDDTAKTVGRRVGDYFKEALQDTKTTE